MQNFGLESENSFKFFFLVKKS